MYEKLLKIVLYTWGFVFLVFGIKLLISHSDTITKLPEKIWGEVKNYAVEWAYNDTITLPLYKKYGMTIEGISLCQNEDTDHKVHLIKDPTISNISSSCWNGDCKVKMVFKNKVPERIKLHVKLPHSDNCLVEEYNTESTVDIVAYKTKLIISKALEEKLGLDSGDEEIRFKHDTGYTKMKVKGDTEMTFDFDTLLHSDMLMVDGEEKLTVYFELK